MKVLHRVAQFRMPLLADDATDGRLRDHIRGCISCQAEASRYRSLQRLVSAFGAEVEHPPYDLVPGVLAGLDRPYLEVKRRVKAGAAAGAAVAVAAAVVVARMVRRRAA